MEQLVSYQKLIKNFKPERQDYYNVRLDDFLGRSININELRPRSDGSMPSDSWFNWSPLIIQDLLGFAFDQDIDYKFLDAYDFEELKHDLNMNLIDTQSYFKCLLYGKAVEVVYYEEGEIKINSYKPIDWQFVKDECDCIYYAINKKTIKAGSIYNGDYIEKDKDLYIIYDDTYISTFIETDNGEYKLLFQVEHGIMDKDKNGLCPVVEFRINENWESTITDALLSKFRAYNMVDVDYVDDVHYNVDSMLIVKGMSLSAMNEKLPDKIVNGRTIAGMSWYDWVRQNHFMPLQSDASAEFLKKGNDNEKYQGLLAQIAAEIHILSHTVDVKDIVGVTGATSGIALRMKFRPLADISNTYTSYFIKSLHKRFDLINAIRENIMNEPEFEIEQIVFTYALSENEIEMWNAAPNLQKIGIPDEDIIHTLPSFRNFDTSALNVDTPTAVGPVMVNSLNQSGDMMVQMDAMMAMMA